MLVIYSPNMSSVSQISKQRKQVGEHGNAKPTRLVTTVRLGKLCSKLACCISISLAAPVT